MSLTYIIALCLCAHIIERDEKLMISQIFVPAGSKIKHRLGMKRHRYMIFYAHVELLSYSGLIEFFFLLLDNRCVSFLLKQQLFLISH